MKVFIKCKYEENIWIQSVKGSYKQSLNQSNRCDFSTKFSNWVGATQRFFFLECTNNELVIQDSVCFIK